MERMDQPKITGYRKLSDEEGALMNEIKAKGAEFHALFEKVKAHLADQRQSAFLHGPAELPRIERAEPGRWAALARTHFQEGCMALTRAVAQPDSF